MRGIGRGGSGPSAAPRRATLVAALGVVLATVAVGGCGSSGSSSSLAGGQRYYVSLGDSYAAAYQATGPHSGHTTRNGFAYQIPALAAAKGYHLKLVNFACGGATTTSMLHSPGCKPANRGPGEGSYGQQTQAAVAVAFLRAHRDQVGLITVSIGGNDVLPCRLASQPVPCVAAATQHIRANLSTLLAQLRGAAGPQAAIVGTTYPDVVLADLLSKQASQQQLAQLSVVAFRSLINPALRSAYSGAGGTFVDVTAASGAYGPLSATTDLPPYGRIPVPVARVCQLTFMCQYQNIHPTTPGYTLIANLVVAALPPARAGGGS